LGGIQVEKRKTPSLANSFSFEIVAKISGKKVSGTFVFHRPTIGEKFKIECIENKRLCGLSREEVNTETYSMVHKISVLDVVTDKAPSWWNIDKIYDSKILDVVYSKYLEKVNNFKSSLNIKQEAEKLLNSSLDYWFRQKYNLSPKDPRYLDCEPWEIEMELELQTLMNDKVKSIPKQQQCPNCNAVMTDIGNICKECGEEVGHVKETYTDPDFDDYVKQVEKEGEEFNAAGGIKSFQWEEVPDEKINGKNS